MEPNLVKPSRLQRGDAIGIIAPAGPVNQMELQPGINLLQSLGYKVILGSNLYYTTGYMAGHDNARLEDLQAMFLDRNIKAIFCARGGYGSLRLIDRVHFEMIRENPKMIVGYSDITALLLTIYKKTGLVTFHGPVVKELSKNNKKNLISFLNLVSSNKPFRLNLREGTAIRTGKGTGVFLGGNLSLITSLLGTPFMPSLKGAILFLEDKGEPLYRIDRMLTQLKLSGVLDGLKGLVSGRFEDCGELSFINRLLLDVVSGKDFPVVSGLPVGHGQENIALPLGLTATLDTDLMTLSFTESCVIP